MEAAHGLHNASKEKRCQALCPKAVHYRDSEEEPGWHVVSCLAGTSALADSSCHSQIHSPPQATFSRSNHEPSSDFFRWSCLRPSARLPSLPLKDALSCHMRLGSPSHGLCSALALSDLCRRPPGKPCPPDSHLSQELLRPGFCLFSADPKPLGLGLGLAPHGTFTCMPARMGSPSCCSQRPGISSVGII